MITAGINQSAYSCWRVAIKNLNHCDSVMTRLKIDRSNKQKNNYTDIVNWLPKLSENYYYDEVDTEKLWIKGNLYSL